MWCDISDALLLLLSHLPYSVRTASIHFLQSSLFLAIRFISPIPVPVFLAISSISSIYALLGLPLPRLPSVLASIIVQIFYSRSFLPHVHTIRASFLEIFRPPISVLIPPLFSISFLLSRYFFVYPFNCVPEHDVSLCTNCLCSLKWMCTFYIQFNNLPNLFIY